MKWNNRLKSVLATPEKGKFSADCLETELRITAKTKNKTVSTLNRSDEFRHLPENLTNSVTAEKQTNLVSAGIRDGHSIESFKKTDELFEYKADKLHQVLNRHIAEGIMFDVSADDFQVIDNKQALKTSDREFLKLNGAVILCQLQQSLLMKHLFSHSPDRFEDFVFEVMERESLLTITAKTPFEIYLFAVKDVTKKWFAELLV